MNSPATFVTFTDEDRADAYMRRLNRSQLRVDVAVVVDGPGDGEFTVMPLREAIEAGFFYRWAA